ncbi:MAG: hypothetical protein ACREIS_07295 [Nitrospiraceae bacterium]
MRDEGKGRCLPPRLFDHVVSRVTAVALLPAALLLATARPIQSAEPRPAEESAQEPPDKPEWARTLGLGGLARFDYYTASKRLDGVHNLPGLTFQPKALPKFGSWGDAKIEGRITDQDLRREGGVQGRLLEAYANVYLGSVDLRLGKQIITWGRADATNPTDNLTPKDFTLLSARDEEERRTGSYAAKANFYRGDYTLSLVWIPIFNPSTIPLTAPPGFTLTEDKRDSGAWTYQGFAAKLDHTGGDLDWSVSYYYGLDVNPVGVPLSPTSAVLIHTRIHVVGADFARTIGRYGIRGEGAYVHTQNPDGSNPFIKKPYVWYVLGVDRDITEDLNITVQAYQRIIINYQDPFQFQDPVIQNASVLDATFNYQLDRIQEGLNGRIKTTWWNKTLEGELLGQWNLNRGDFFLRPSLAYAFTDVWKGFMGYDIFNGQRHSFFGRLEPMTSFFAEIRATF